MKIKLLVWCLLLSVISQAQKQRCGTDELNQSRILQNPTLLEIHKKNELTLQQSIDLFRKKRLNVSIPVVVHVIYNADNENISNEQIYSQVDVLNRDFNLNNIDTLQKSHPFYSLMGNVGIKFELAKIDPNGKETTGITRTKTTKLSWGTDDLNNDNMKFTSTGGIENWDPTKYLNIYTVRFADSVQLLGYAYFPEDLASYPETDGVVIDFRCFGTLGTSGTEGLSAYNLGRTVTHEVGHWLGLRHIWGDLVYDTDKKCGDDLVSDTPPAEGDNSGQPTFPHRPNNHCGSDANGEMYMNYMDYVHDKSMVMFSKGQATRMLAAISTYRKNFISKASISEISENQIQIKNNPISTTIELLLNEEYTNGKVEVFDLVGNLCLVKSVSLNDQILDASTLNYGEYILVFKTNNEIFRSKFVKL